jgi:hypothetical protein
MVVTPVVSPPLLFLPALFTAYDYQKFRDDEGSSKSKAKESVLGASLGGVCAKKKKKTQEKEKKINHNGTSPICPVVFPHR